MIVFISLLLFMLIGFVTIIGFVTKLFLGRLKLKKKNRWKIYIFKFTQNEKLNIELRWSKKMISIFICLKLS